MKLNSIDAVEAALTQHDYIPDRALATTVFLALKLGKAIFLEGEPGVGKTELAKVLAQILDTELIRLQCYEGLDAPAALYEWNYPRQMLELRLQEARGVAKTELGANIFAREFLLERPLLKAISAVDSSPVLLIDEVDRSDEEFEALLLEVLSDFQVTVPELGTLNASHKPIVILTSNRTRELHDALKRRCLYHWLDYPDIGKEVQIVQARVPGIDVKLSKQLAFFMQQLRGDELYKRPGIAETIDWAEALLAMGAKDLDSVVLEATLGCIVKYKADIERLRSTGLASLLKQARDNQAFAESPTNR